MAGDHILSKALFILPPTERNRAVVFTPKSRAAEAGAGGTGEEDIGAGGNGEGGDSKLGGAPCGIGSNPDSYGVSQGHGG